MHIFHFSAVGELVKCLGIARHCIATVSHWFHFFTVHLFLTAAVPLVLSSSHCGTAAPLLSGLLAAGNRAAIIAAAHTTLWWVKMSMVVKRWWWWWWWKGGDGEGYGVGVDGDGDDDGGDGYQDDGVDGDQDDGGDSDHGNFLGMWTKWKHLKTRCSAKFMLKKQNMQHQKKSN